MARRCAYAACSMRSWGLTGFCNGHVWQGRRSSTLVGFFESVLHVCVYCTWVLAVSAQVELAVGIARGLAL